jgi:CheY-like chemotaxis protein
MKRFFTVLSVDDSTSGQSLLQEAVIRTETPFHIQPFFSPEAALIYLRGQPPFDNRKIYPFPSLILCNDNLKSGEDDLDVSGKGSNVVARIRTISSCAGLPIIMLGQSQCSEGGAGHFLHKPTSPSGLGIFVQSLYACATSAPLFSTASDYPRLN